MIVVQGNYRVLKAFIEPKVGLALYSSNGKGFGVAEIFLPKNFHIWQSKNVEWFNTIHEAEQAFATKVDESLPTDYCEDCGSEYTDPDNGCDSCHGLKILN